jgi:hypothetical protein
MSGPKTPQAAYSIDGISPASQDAYFVFQDNAGGGTSITGPLVIQGAGAALEINDSTGTAVVILEPNLGQVGNGRVAIQAGGTGGNAGSGGALIGLDNGGIALDYYSDATATTYRVIQTNPAQGDLLLGASNAGSIVQINGSAGFGRVYDATNNRPQPGPEFTLSTFSSNMTQTPFAYTVTTSGWYVFNSYINLQGAGFSWPAGTVITLRLQANGNEVQFSQASWWDMPNPPPSGIEDNRDCLIQLTAGDVLTVQLSTLPSPPALGASGAVICNIQSLLA